MSTKRKSPGSFRKKQLGNSDAASVPRTAVVEDTLLLSAVQSYFKKAAIVLAVWTVGYFKYSPSWLLLGLVVYVWKEKQNAHKRNQIAIARQLARDEKEVVLARVDDLPSWVYFPDVERAQWINKMVEQMWPFIGDYVRQLLQETIEPQIRASLPPSLGSFKFSKIDLGDIPPRIGGVKVYTKEIKRDEIYMDLEINYASDCNLAVQIKGMSFGIRDFTLRGTMRIIFRPLINKVPLIGGMSIFFLNNPEIDFNLTSLANALDLPGLSDMLHSIIQEQIAAIMVLPNRIPIQLASDIDLRRLRYPQPQGVLRVHVIEAKDLMKADFNIAGKGKSDPYAIITVGAQSCQTKVINNTVDPTWNQNFEFIIDERDGQVLDIALKDKDPGNKDDHLGNTSLDVGHIFEKGIIDEWLPLEDAKTGMVHIRATWLYLANDPLELDRMVAQVKESGFEEDSIHSALLLVNLDSAVDLPRGKKTLMEPSPFALLTVGQTTRESTVRPSTTEPRWEQNFRFFVANPNHQNLEIAVRDGKTKKDIGLLTVRLKDILNAEDMFLEKRFQLKNAEANSSLYMAVVLRILTPEANEEWDDIDSARRPERPPTQESTGVDGPSSSVDSKPAAAATDKPSTMTTPTTPAPSTPSARQSTTSADEAVVLPAASPAPVESEVRLRKGASSPGSASSNSVTDAGQFGLGRVQLTLRYSRQSTCLIIVVHKISNLKPAEGDSKGMADPYIKLYLLPDKDSKSKRRTSVKKDSLNPIFDETFEYPVGMQEVSKRTLELTVKNEVGMFSSSKSLLGMVLLDLGTLDIAKAVTQWFDLAPLDKLKASSLVSEV